VRWHCDLWFGGVGCCLIVAVVCGDVAEKRKKELVETISFFKKTFFLRVIPLRQ